MVEESDQVDAKVGEKVDRQVQRKLQKVGLESDLDAENEGGPFYRIAPCIYKVRLPSGMKVFVQLTRGDTEGKEITIVRLATG